MSILSGILRIGPSGNSDSFYASGRKHTWEEAGWLSELGLNAFEYSFGRGVSMSDATAEKIRTEMDRYGIEVSAHAPYYTNFANPDREMADKSIGYVLQSLAAVRRMGGERVVVHPAAQGKAEREAAVAEAERNFHRLAEALVDAGDCKICLETLGKIRQVGRVEEVLRFCKISDRFYPCFDFGHINCYTMGGIRTKDDYRRIIDASFDALGEEKTRNMHVHFSKIAYGAGGESHHLTFADETFGPDYRPLAELIDEYGLTPFVVCESDGTMADDAVLMKNMHKNV